MSRRFLNHAAAAAGITEGQAEAFVRAILNPSHLMASAGAESVGLTALAFSKYCPPELAGFTSGETEQTEAAAIWRRMAAALLARDDFAKSLGLKDWPAERWPHPASDHVRDWSDFIAAIGREAP